MWREIGPSALVGIGIYYLMFPLHIALAKIFASLRTQAAAATDERVKTVQEVRRTQIDALRRRSGTGAETVGPNRTQPATPLSVPWAGMMFYSPFYCFRCSLSHRHLYFLFFSLDYYAPLFSFLYLPARIISSPPPRSCHRSRQILSGMRVLKLYNWAMPFRDLVNKIRSVELRAIRTTNIIRGGNMAFYFSAATITAFFTFLTYELVEGGLTAARVFTVYGILQGIRLPLGFFFPIGVQSFAEVGVSIRRFERFLRLKEHPSLAASGRIAERTHTFAPLTEAEAAVAATAAGTSARQAPRTAVNGSAAGVNGNAAGVNGNAAAVNGTAPASNGTTHASASASRSSSPLPPADPEHARRLAEASAAGTPFVHFDRVTASWTDGDVLRNVSLHVGPGQLLAVVGPVGAGKSSLLMAALGELLPRRGTITVCGSTGYSSQEAWILNETVRNNILFGAEYDAEWYGQVVSACNMARDLELFENGSDTEIGERGVTLSGGQKARLSLARAVYSRADIYLLDDPLSAVDAKVGRSLFDDCINGILADKARILITHQVQYLRAADKIAVLDANGTIMAEGEAEQGRAAAANKRTRKESTA